MKLLLGSGGVRTPERKSMYLQLMNENFRGCQKILFIPYASKDYDEYTNKVKEMFKESKYEIIGIHESDNPMQEIREMEGIYVGGGNTFTLVRKLHEEGLIESIRKRVIEDNIPYAGVSAGSNVACPTMQTTNDMPIELVPSFETFGIIKFQINPHYYPGGIWWKDEENGILNEHFGESRKRRIDEYHQYNEKPVIGLYEGSFLRCDETGIELLGNKAVIIRKNQDMLTIEENQKLNYDLSTR